MVKKRKAKKVSKSRISKNSWFRKDIGAKKTSDWGWIPLNYKGAIALGIFIFLNVFSAQYFDPLNAPWDDVSSFLVVLLLSFFVFIAIAKRKTKG